MADPVERFGLFVSSVQDHPVTRFGTRTIIGATRSSKTPTVVTFDTSAIVAIPIEEYERFSREYDRALGNGSLERRKPAEWQAQLASQRRLDETRRKEREQQGEGTPSAPESPAQE